MDEEDDDDKKHYWPVCHISEFLRARGEERSCRKSRQTEFSFLQLQSAPPRRIDRKCVRLLQSMLNTIKMRNNFSFYHDLLGNVFLSLILHGVKLRLHSGRFKNDSYSLVMYEVLSPSVYKSYLAYSLAVDHSSRGASVLSIIKDLVEQEKRFWELWLNARMTKGGGEIIPVSILSHRRFDPRFLVSIADSIYERRWRTLGQILGENLILRTLTGERMSHTTFGPFSVAKKINVLISRYVSLAYYPILNTIFHAAMLRLMYLKTEHEGSHSARLINILEAFVKGFGYEAKLAIASFMADALIFLFYLDDLPCSTAIVNLERCRLYTKNTDSEYRFPYRAYKVLVQFETWRKSLTDCRMRSLTPEEARGLGDSLGEAGKDLGEVGLVFVLAALRVFSTVADEEDAATELALSFAARHPRCTRALTEYLQMEGETPEDITILREEAVKLPAETDDSERVAARVHEADGIWVEWARPRVQRPLQFGPEQEVYGQVARVLFAFLDYSPNKTCAEAWELLDIASFGSDAAVIKELWRERAEWWPRFHSLALPTKAAEMTRSRLFAAFEQLSFVDL